MDHRGLFKTKLTIRGGQDHRKYFKNKRAMERDDMRNFGRDITIANGNSPIPICSTNEERNHFKQQFKMKYRETVLNKENILKRPPFISVVPVGKFMEAPTTTALSKLITKSQENIQKILTAKKVFPPKTPEIARRSKRNIKRLNLNVESNTNQFNNYLKKNGRENAGFTFVHSTTAKTKNKHQKTIVLASNNFAVSDEDDLAGISPIEPDCNEAQALSRPIPQIAIVEPNNQVEIGNGLLPKPQQGTRDETTLPSPNSYKSPYVTLSRGQNKRETIKLSSDIKLNVSFELDEDDNDEMKMYREAALKYEIILNNEITRLEELIQKWESYRLENMELEDCVEMIEGTVGQTKLLISSKFLQFRKTIDNCRFQNGDRPVFPDDLVGFWDVIKLQIKNVDDRFIKLEKLRVNDWKEDATPAKIINTKKTGKKRKNNRKSILSNLKDMIQSKRQQKINQENAEVEATTSGTQTRQNERSRKNTPPNKYISANVRTSEINDELDNLKIDSPLLTKSVKIRGKSIRFVEPRKSSDSDVVFLENSPEEEKGNQTNGNGSNETFTPSNPKRSSKKYRDTPKIPLLNLIDTPQSRRRSMRTPKSKLSFCDELHNCSIRDSPIRPNKRIAKRSRRITALIDEQ